MTVIDLSDSDRLDVITALRYKAERKPSTTWIEAARLHELADRIAATIETRASKIMARTD